MTLSNQLKSIRDAAFDGRVQQVREQADQAFSHHSDNADANYTVAVCLFQDGCVAASRSFFQRTLALDPQHFDAALVLDLISADTQDFLTPVVMYGKQAAFIRANTDRIVAHPLGDWYIRRAAVLARVLGEAGDEVYLWSLVATLSGDPVDFAALAQAYADHNQPDDSAKALEMGRTAQRRPHAVPPRKDNNAGSETPDIDRMLLDLWEKPNDSGANFNFGVYLYDNKFNAMSCCYFHRAFDLDKGNVVAGIYLASSCFRFSTNIGNSVGRRVTMDVLDRFPHIHDTEVGLTLFRYMKDYAEEDAQRIYWLEKVVERSGLAADYDSLASFYAEQDRLEDAQKAMKKAAELEPEQYTAKLKNLFPTASPAEQKIEWATYPTHKVFNGDIDTLLKKHTLAHLKDAKRFITPATTFFTIGSCYSQALYISLQGLGYKANHFGFDEMGFSTYGSRTLIDYLAGTLPESAAAYGPVAGCFLPGMTKDSIVAAMQMSNVLVLSLGVSQAFFDRETGEFVIPPHGRLGYKALAGKYIYRNVTVAENVDNIKHVINFVRSVNPAIKILLLVAPVPLKVTFNTMSSVAADCLSKSTLRLAAEEVVYASGISDIYYWPSLEHFRWVSGHRGALFGVDDGRSEHGSDDMVRREVRNMIEVLSV